ncbi:response regulator [bacterium]|nr:MAG: response regulator [bacterium]
MLNRTPSKRPVKILMAEDSPTQALKLRRILDGRGYEVEAARNGKDALDFLLELKQNEQVWQNHRPALLISDIVMPEMDGCELCRRIKTDEVLKSLPVILLTSLSDSRDALRGLYSGADNLISKPYDEPFLLARIDDILAAEEASENAMAGKVMPITMDGQKYFVNADRLRVINLILTTYETAVQKNLQLEATEQLVASQKVEIEKLKAELEALRRE